MVASDSPPRFAHELAAGTLIAERYRVTGPAGVGGSGSVFLADDTRLSCRPCAVKAYFSTEPSGAQAIEALAREAAVLVQLDHPSIPRVTDVVVDEGMACLVMDFVPGRDLAAVVTDAWRHGRRLDCATVIDWADDLLEAIGYLHRHDPPVIHGDIKPSNVKLTPDGQLRLVDFGLATSRAETDPKAATVTLARGGSPPFQPLEQASGGPVDARSDLYSVGATLFHLLTGHPPPPAAERFIAAESKVAIQAYRDDVPDGLARAIDTALSLHPDQRPASAEAMLAMIHGAVGANRGEGVWPAAVRRNWWLVALVLVLLFAAGALSVTP